MRILAISGSLKASSSNTMLVRALAKFAPAEVEFTIYDGLTDLPFFSPDLDNTPAHVSVQFLRSLIQTTDAVLISTPEYAYGVPGVLKNALDWTVSSGEFSNKPVAVISASPNAAGGEKAHASILLTLKALNANVPEKAKLIVPFVRKKIADDGQITDPATQQALTTVMAALSQAVATSASKLVE